VRKLDLGRVRYPYQRGFIRLKHLGSIGAFKEVGGVLEANSGLEGLELVGPHPRDWGDGIRAPPAPGGLVRKIGLSHCVGRGPPELLNYAEIPTAAALGLSSPASTPGAWPTLTSLDIRGSARTLLPPVFGCVPALEELNVGLVRVG
jgi:hypothetical protein